MDKRMQHEVYVTGPEHPTFGSMSTSGQNKEIVIRMVHALSGKRKDRDLVMRFADDESLIQHFLFFDSLFPGNELLIDELTSEGNRAVLRLRLRGRQEGPGGKRSAPHREIEFPMVFGFEFEHRKIISHWLIADQASLMSQLERSP